MPELITINHPYGAIIACDNEPSENGKVYRLFVDSCCCYIYYGLPLFDGVTKKWRAYCSGEDRTTYYGETQTSSVDFSQYEKNLVKKLNYKLPYPKLLVECIRKTNVDCTLMGFNMIYKNERTVNFTHVEHTDDCDKIWKELVELPTLSDNTYSTQILVYKNDFELSKCYDDVLFDYKVDETEQIDGIMCKISDEYGIFPLQLLFVRKELPNKYSLQGETWKKENILLL